MASIFIHCSDASLPEEPPHLHRFALVLSKLRTGNLNSGLWRTLPESESEDLSSSSLRILQEDVKLRTQGYRWKAKRGVIEVGYGQLLKALADKDRRLKRLVADPSARQRRL